MSAAAAATAPKTDAVEALAAKLEVTVIQLRTLPRELLMEAMEEAGFEPKQKAAVMLRLQGMGASREDTLVAHFVEESQRAREPWRATYQRLAAERAEINAIPFADLRASFFDLARTQMLSPEDALVGTYLLYGGEADVRFLAAILQKQKQERILAHNFFVASGMPASWLASHGEQLVTLQFPLFPPAKEFSALNLRILQETATPKGGAGTQQRPSVFREEAPEGGEYVAVVQQHPSGAAVVDLTVVENAVKDLQMRCNMLEKANASRQRNPRNGSASNGAPNGNTNNSNNNRGARYPPRGAGDAEQLDF